MIYKYIFNDKALENTSKILFNFIGGDRSLQKAVWGDADRKKQVQATMHSGNLPLEQSAHSGIKEVVVLALWSVPQQSET